MIFLIVQKGVVKTNYLSNKKYVEKSIIKPHFFVKLFQNRISSTFYELHHNKCFHKFNNSKIHSLIFNHLLLK